MVIGWILTALSHINKALWVLDAFRSMRPESTALRPRARLSGVRVVSHVLFGGYAFSSELPGRRPLLIL